MLAERIWRISLASAFVLLFVGRFGIWLDIFSPWVPLSISALATNLAYSDGTRIDGIEWKHGYGDLRLTIGNNSESSIQNLDLNIWIVSKGTILDMGQLSDIDGVKFNIADTPEMNIKIRAADGQDAMLPLLDNLGTGKRFPFSKQWKMFCPRLGGRIKLKLVLIASSENSVVQATTMRVFGSYELMPSEGSKTMVVDTTISIEQ